MTKRPIKFKLDAYRSFNGGMTALEAFQEASRLNHKIALSGCMTTKAYASSYMSDDIKNYLRKQISLDNTDVITYFNNNGLDLSF